MADSSDIKGFFIQLRQLASAIDTSTGQLRSRIDNPPKEEFSSATILKLQEKRKEVKTLKTEGQDRLISLQSEGGQFVCVLSACNQLVDSQQQLVHTIETFLKQYGYATWGEVTAREDDQHAVERTKQKVNTESVQDHLQPSVETPPVKEARSRTGTPKLEDYEWSEYTLQALTACRSRGGQQPPEMRSLSQIQHQITQSDRGLAIKSSSEIGDVTGTKTGHCSNAGTETRMEQPHIFKTPTRLVEKAAAYGTPKLEDFGLSEFTMQSLNKFQAGEKTVVTGLNMETQYGYPSPQTGIPSPFQHNGIIVTPSLVSGRPFPMETPAEKRGGVAGFEVLDSPFQPPGGITGSRSTAYKNDPKLKLQDCFEESMSSWSSYDQDSEQFDQAGRSLSADVLPSSGDMISARLQNLQAQSSHMDRKTPPEPELLSSRLKSLRQANSKNDGATPPEPELLSSRLNTLLVTSNPTSIDTATPPEPELLISRLTKLRAASSGSCVPENQPNDTMNSSISVAGLPKPLSERPYYLSDVPEPPRFLGKYRFEQAKSSHNSQENVAPS